MNLPARLVRLVPALFFALVHSAQSAQFDPLSSNTLGELQLFDTVGNFTRTSAVELDGDFRPDVALLVGSQVVLSLSPGIYDAFVDLDTVAADVVGMPGASAGQLGSVLVSQPSAGLQRWALDLPTLTFRATSVGSSIWAGAVELRAADVTGDGELDLVGLAASRRTVLWLAGPLEAGVEGSLDLAETVHRLITLEWDGTSGEELALLTTGGVRVLEVGGSLLLAETTDGDDSDRFTAVHRTGQTDRLVTVVKLPDRNYRFFAADSLHWDLMSQIGNFPLVSVVAADFDGDGLDDVCVNHKVSRDPYYFANQAGASVSFGWSEHAVWDLESGADSFDDPALNLATPTLCDLDGDQDVDVFHPFRLMPTSPYERIVRMCRSVRIDHRQRAPRVIAARYDAVAGGASGVLSLDLLPPLAPPAEDDALSVVVWYSRVLAVGVPTSAAAVHAALVDLTWSENAAQTLPIPLTFPVFSDAVFHIELRLVETDSQPAPQVLSASSASLWTFTTGDTSFGSFADFGVSGVLETPVDVDGAALASGGWTGPMPCLPCFPDNDVPAPGGGN